MCLEFTIDQWLRLFQIIATFTVGGAGVFIAWQQMRSTNLRLKMDMYDRRLRVYDSVQTLLFKMGYSRLFNEDDILKFLKQVEAANFLFNDDVKHEIAQLKKLGFELCSLSEEIADNLKQKNDPGVGVQDERAALQLKRRKIKENIRNTAEKSLRLFDKYLDLTK